jgi:magnesium chelatase family protein
MNLIDIHMQLPRVEYQKLRDMRPGETSAEVRVRVEAARQHQRVRFGGTDIASNADMRPAQIRKYCVLDEACQSLMKTAMRQIQLIARVYHRVLKLSRTIAVLAGSEAITQVHLAEALQYQPKLELM